jgi:hypothetical protein
MKSPPSILRTSKGSARRGGRIPVSEVGTPAPAFRDFVSDSPAATKDSRSTGGSAVSSFDSSPDLASILSGGSVALEQDFSAWSPKRGVCSLAFTGTRSGGSQTQMLPLTPLREFGSSTPVKDRPGLSLGLHNMRRNGIDTPMGAMARSLREALDDGEPQESGGWVQTDGISHHDNISLGAPTVS